MIIKNYKINKYIDVIKDGYKLNKFVLDEKQKIMNNFKLEKNKYSWIFIRRGDKLMYESKYISSETYINLLLKKNPLCKKNFCSDWWL